MSILNIDTIYDTTYNISRRFPYVKMGKARL